MPQIVLNVTDEQLEKMEAEFLRYADSSYEKVEVTNRVELLQSLIQQDCLKFIDVWTGMIFDEGGNSLGDVFWDYDDLKGVTVTEIDD